MRRIVTAREQAEMTTPWQRQASDDFDEDAFWAKHEQTMKLLRSQAQGLRYVTPTPGTSLAVGPNWSGTIPKGHPDYIPGQAARDDIHGYLNHGDDGHVNFIYTNPNMRQMGVGRKLLDHAGITDIAHAINMTPDGKAFSDAIRRTAAPWYSKPGDQTFQVPTSDILKHRQFNPSPSTPEDMFNTLYRTPWSSDGNAEPYRTPRDSDFHSGGGDEGSHNADSIVDAYESGQAHKLPPVEISTNGVGATLTDGNHRAETADMMSQPEMSSYIHYNPHGQMDDDDFESAVDPDSALGKHIHQLVQNHPYEPLGDNSPSTRYVFRQHPETSQWQRGRVDHHSPPQYVDSDDYAQQMMQDVPGYKHDGPGTYYDVDWGNGNELTHSRHLHARRTAMADYDEYAGHHQAPGPGTGWPAWDMAGEHGTTTEEYGGVPADWYTHPHYYAAGETSPRDLKATQKVYNDMRGNPDAMVNVYRALPQQHATHFNTGDWITTSPEYAQQHADGQGDGTWSVMKAQVPAKHLYHNGDSYYEMGYHGPKIPGQVG